MTLTSPSHLPSRRVVRASDSGTPPRRSPGYRILWIEDGHGVYQVDFQHYVYAGPRILFLEPGQYFSVLTGAITLTDIAVPAPVLAQNHELAVASRVLFTHVYEAGAIAPPSGLPPVALRAGDEALEAWLHDAARHWRAQKPLHPHITPDETDLIFDLRQLIEAQYRERRPVGDYARALGASPRWINHTTTSCINRTLGALVQSRQLLEAKRDLFFTDKPVQEIAYDLDFSDPAYFSRFFSRAAGLSPVAFRERHAASRANPFLEDVWRLIEQHYRHDRSVAFYAAHFFLTPKALSAKVKRETGQSFGRLVRGRVIAEARRLLTTTDLPIQEIARYLGFEEAPHFSYFFKQATGLAPLVFRQQR